ncbi:Chaperone protein dnaJ 49 [Morus notabilis]|uniref:Chaperone protein dnaJ 49 n=1 Tax=Morus notabilis TaxID=981085 RepID=W9RF96_9ROSA|nr:chaperone protein dnaJ 49 [Morus notabilis]XP_024019294.1 chaperone protein dnaJ 49 [Morus notabilis]EXB53736.1 Chaperone protein dnaJ 49 [Morus notabilis]
MDGNKDDALKCLKIGKYALESGDRARALKFITKAQRLDPTLPIDDLLSAIEKDSVDGAPKDTDLSSNGHPSDSPSSKPSDQPSLRHRVPTTGASSSSVAAAYTEEQIAIVRQIKKKKDYYEILGLEKSCIVEDVRKAYRKLSLKVHPDKNKAPGAEEAFKAVSKAFQCLSNEENRKKYDLVGSDEPVYERRTTRHAANGFNGGFYDAEFDADEIFRNFFFGGMAPATQFRGFSFGTGMGPRPADHHHGSGVNLRALIQILPVLLILLLNFLPSSDPIYALSRSYPYEYKFTTEKGVNFYVKSTKFEEDYLVGSRERANIEHQVEREYFNILSQNCQLEIQRRQWGFIRETPHCDMLRQFKSKAY